MTADEERYLTTEEAEVKLTSLSQAEYNRLRELARRFVVEPPFRDADDLLMEAFEKILLGERRWRKDLGVGPFFKGVFRSLRSSHVKSVSRRAKHRDIRLDSDTLQGDESGDRAPTQNAAGDPESPELIAMAEETSQRFQQVFEGDELAWNILQWRSAGFTREEIKNEFGLTDTQYETITKRIRRKTNLVQKAEERSS